MCWQITGSNFLEGLTRGSGKVWAKDSYTPLNISGVLSIIKVLNLKRYAPEVAFNERFASTKYYEHRQVPLAERIPLYENHSWHSIWSNPNFSTVILIKPVYLVDIGSGRRGLGFHCLDSLPGGTCEDYFSLRRALREKKIDVSGFLHRSSFGHYSVVNPEMNWLVAFLLIKNVRKVSSAIIEGSPVMYLYSYGIPFSQPASSSHQNVKKIAWKITNEAFCRPR